MQDQKQCYKRNDFDLFLEERIGGDEEAAMMSHIAECEKCRIELEKLAGNQDVWNDIQEQLVDDDSFGEETKDSEFRSRQRDLRKVQDMLAPTDHPEMMGRLGSYEICGVIGRGSAGIVVKALDPRLNRYVAIKMLAPVYSNNGCSRRRFEREGKAIASVKDPHVVPIHLVEEFQGTPYIVMQYVPDGSLDNRIKKEGPLKPREAVCIGMQVAQGLAAAHKRGIVHRDVKPANVLLDNGVDGAMVTDFGLARVVDEATMTRSGSISGTPQFMSPEQAKGERVDPRSDLFSLGSMLYAACTGHAPFKSESVFGIIKKVCDSEPTPIREFNPDIPEWLVAFIKKLQAKDPGARFKSADQVASLLSQELAHMQSPTMVTEPERNWWVKPIPAPPVKPAPTPTNKTVLMLCGTIAATLLAVFMVSSFWGNGDKTPPNNISSLANSMSPSNFLTFVQQENEKLEEFENKIESTFDVQDGGELFLRSNLGTLNITTHDKPTVEMDLVYTVKATDKETASKLFKALDLNYEIDAKEAKGAGLTKGQDAVIIADFPTREVREEEIKAAETTEQLQALREQLLIRRNSHQKNARFEIRIPKKFSVNLKSGSGPIKTNDIDGHATLISHGGHIDAGSVSGIVDFTSHGGKVIAGDLGENAKIISHGGLVELGDVDGDLFVESHGGYIHANEVSGKVDAITHGGRISLQRVAGYAKVETHGGGIAIWRAESGVDAKAPAGKIKVNFVGQPKKDSRLESSAGSIQVGMVEGLGFDIDASTTVGGISSPFGKKSSKLQHKLNDGENKLVAITNVGSVKFAVVTNDEIDSELKEAKANHQERRKENEGQAAFNAAYDLHMEGKIDEAIIAHKKAAEHEDYTGIATYNLGCAWALKGEKDKAFAALNKAIDHDFTDLEQYETDSDLDSLRDDERFEKVMERVKAGRKSNKFGGLFNLDKNNSFSAIIGKNLGEDLSQVGDVSDSSPNKHDCNECESTCKEGK